MLDELLRRWGASDPALVAETSTSRIFRVRLQDGTAVVKEITPAVVADELRGADLLAWRDGVACVRLLARHGATLLMEDAGTLSLLDHLHEHGDASATVVAADALAALHAPVRRPMPDTLASLEEHFASLFARSSTSADPLLPEAADMARELLSHQRDVQPIHGDFHHENLLLGQRGWLAIDPKGLLGDPAYDAANLFSNPLDRDDLRLDPDRIRDMAAVLGAALHREPVILQRWAFAHSCLSASWHLADGDAEMAARSLGVARAIRGVLD